MGKCKRCGASGVGEGYCKKCLTFLQLQDDTDSKARGWYYSLSYDERQQYEKDVAQAYSEANDSEKAVMRSREDYMNAFALKTAEYMRTEYGGEKQAARAKAYQKWYRSTLPSRLFRLCLKVALWIAAAAIVVFLLFRFTLYGDLAISGIVGIFGSETAGENAAMNVVRKASAANMIYGDEITDAEFNDKKTALVAFMNSGSSYRMSGEVAYGYQATGGSDGYSTHRGRIKYTASYNNEFDVYKFEIEEIAYTGEKLESIFKSVKKGTYYIVKENGVEYLLSDIGGVKTVTNVSENRAMYNILMGLRMEKVIGLDFLDQSETNRGSLYGGDCYEKRMPSTYVQSVYRNPGVTLKTFNDKPVYHYYNLKDEILGFDRQFEYNFYYNKIPKDNPSVADWK